MQSEMARLDRIEEIETELLFCRFDEPPPPAHEQALKAELAALKAGRIYCIISDNGVEYSSADRSAVFHEARFYSNKIILAEFDTVALATGQAVLRDVTAELVRDWWAEVGASHCAGRDPDWTRPWLAGVDPTREAA